MHRPYGAGVSVVGHTGDFAQGSFLKLSVGDNHAYRGISREFVFHNLCAGIHQLFR